MNTLKFLKNNLVKFNGVLYTPYMVGDLPPSFGFINDDNKETEGISEWINFRGLTYVIKR